MRLPVTFSISTSLWLVTTCSASAYPPYAEWISKKAGFQANCAYCHLNSQGPIGSGPGQTGSLSDLSRSQLHTGESPIMNEFGKSLIAHLGTDKIVQGMNDPAEIAEAMNAYDLDGDGVSDGIEMAHGTLANDPNSAPPGLIWQGRLRKNAGFVATVAIASVVGAIGCFGLSATFRRRRLGTLSQQDQASK